MTLKCPYCSEMLSPPLASATCPACGKVMAIPATYRNVASGKDKERALSGIARDAQRQRKAFLFQGSPRLGRQPAFIVFVLFGLLALGALVVSRPVATPLPPQEKGEVTRQELRVLATALGLYRHHVGHYPTPDEGGLWALVLHPGVDGWQGRYVNDIFNDAWNSPYRYSPESDPMLFSCGPDKVPGTEDDLQAAPEDFIPAPDLLARWKATPNLPPAVQLLK